MGGDEIQSGGEPSSVEAPWPPPAPPAPPVPLGAGSPDAGPYRAGAEEQSDPAETSTPRRRRHRRHVVVAGATLAAALVATGAVVVLTRDDGPSHPSTWDPRVADLVSVVE